MPSHTFRRKCHSQPIRHAFHDHTQLAHRIKAEMKMERHSLSQRTGNRGGTGRGRDEGERRGPVYLVAAEQIKIGQVIHPVRVAITGKSIGLGLFNSLAILGRKRCLRRIQRALDIL